MVRKLEEVIRELDLVDADEVLPGEVEEVPSLEEILKGIDVAEWKDRVEEEKKVAEVPAIKDVLKDIEAEERAELSSNLVLAVQQRDLFQVQALLRDAADPQTRLPSGESVLEKAVQAGAAGVVGMLLGHGADAAEGLAAAVSAAAEVDVSAFGLDAVGGSQAREAGEDARMLCEIFRDKRAETDERKAVLSRLDPGVLAKVRWRLCFPGPFATGGASPEQSFKAGPVEQLAPATSHHAVIYARDAMRPLLALVPRDGAPTCAVLLLHGFFQSGRMLEGLARELSTELPHTLLLAPTAPTRISHAGVGPSWYWIGETWDPAEAVDPVEQIEACRGELLKLLAVTGGIPPARVAVLGFSQGGGMAAWLALRLPSTAAGLGLFSTEVMSLGRFVGGVRDADGGAVFQGAAGLDVLLCHGASDKVIGIPRARESAEELCAMGCGARLSEHRGVGHVLCRDMVEEARQWLRSVLPVG